MPKQASKVTSKKLYVEISKLDDLKIELENVETQSKGYLKVQLDNINKIKENIEHYMIELVDSDEHESHMPIYKKANKDITEIQSTLLNNLELKENINTKIEETKINIPKFSLPSFKGDPDQWLDFKTTFEDTIINNSSLNNIQKFKYLQSSLSGDAASIIKGKYISYSSRLLTFLEKHRKGLDHINGKIYQKEDNVRKTFKTYQVNTNLIKCTYCNSSHKLATCQEFTKLSLDDRIKFVRSKNLCINCLGVNHYSVTKKHTTLHNYNYQRRQGPISTTEHQANTILIKVFNSNNDELICRALIDSGAQKSLITETLADKLNIAQKHTKVKIAGFNSTIQSQVDKIIKIKLSSIYDNFKFETKALIVKVLSNKIPNFYTHDPVWSHLNNFKLADPEFYIPRPIDIIIGADLYLDLIEPGLIKGPRDAPSAMNSKFGWIISGRSNMPNNTTSTSIQQIHVNHSSAELHDIVKKIGMRKAFLRTRKK
ncbi:hypothetical protein LAZ67_13001386 [Cordylochernes scorpioides]|uniref:DUF1758 domain-containing protein n=1 Tax=Cordylochernes scorpioides TaxID=51811 RepID=A0ABY6L6G2_9ARAC|nr:hypothetical protein LAZ67_13001386 [Cordylochernes scorpioides]